MKQIWAVTQIAIKEDLRNRFIYFIFIMALFFILLARGCSMGYTPSADTSMLLSSAQKLSIHGVFHIIAGWSIVLCTLLSMGSITRELEQGALVMVLARPVSRSALVAGKLLAVIIISVVTLFLLGGIFFGLYYSKTGIANVNIFLGFLGIIFSLILMALLSFLFSLILPRLAVPIVSLFVYMLSMWAELPIFYKQIGRILKPSQGTIMINKILPQFGEIQFFGASIMVSKATLGHCFFSAVNLLFYSLICWCVLIIIFKKKEI